MSWAGALHSLELLPGGPAGGGPPAHRGGGALSQQRHPAHAHPGGGAAAQNEVRATPAEAAQMTTLLLE